MTQPTDHEKSAKLARHVDISKLSTEQKDIMLANLLGLTWDYSQNLSSASNIWIHDAAAGISISSFYDPSCMQYAWRVLNWANERELSDIPATWGDYILDNTCPEALELFSMPPAEAQAAWLDKILELATEAGMVDDD